MTEKYDHKRLAGRVALVTGASRGIGAGIAQRLAQEGADLALTWGTSQEAARVVADACTAYGVRVHLMQADSGSLDAMKGLVSKVVKELGKLDILVNNAGILPLGPVGDTSDETFERAFAINVRAPFVLARDAAEVMKDGGRIITIGSVAAQRTQNPGMHLYAGTKAALAAMTRGWARDLGHRGITCNVVQPGPIDTDMNPADGQWGDYCRSVTALQRYGQPGEVAALVAFLASADGSYVTGTTLDVDGGMEA